MLSDDELLDFETKRLADFNGKDARAWLDDPTRHEVYRAQLVAARWIDGGASAWPKTGPSRRTTPPSG